MRTFDDKPATREQTPMQIGIVGPSTGGKTYSALRLATGIQRVVGGDIFGIDTEQKRMLHYADKFKFRWLEFGAPFSPSDYLDAIQHCVKKGAKTIIIDSMSHEHEGPGGVLEMHEKEVERLCRGDASKAERVKMLAWSKPKQQRRRLINTIAQLPVNVIACFRAKAKLKIERGKEPVSMGYQAIAGEEFVFEMLVKFLLLPNANGVPTLQSDMLGEREVIKIPDQFRNIFAGGQAPQLSEDIGQRLAEWAAGAPSAPTMTIDELVRGYLACSDAATLRALEATRKASWSSLSAADKTVAKEQALAAKERTEAAEAIAAEEATATEGVGQ